MLRFKYMKDFVLLPLRFIAVLLAVLTGGALIQTFIFVSTISQEAREHIQANLLPLFLNGVYQFWLPAVAAAWIISSFQILKQAKHFFVSLLVLFVLVSGVLTGLFFMHGSLKSNVKTYETYNFTVPVKTIMPFPGGFLVANNDETSKIQNILLHLKEPNQTFIVSPTAVKDNHQVELVFPEMALTVPMDNLVGSRTAYFKAPPVLQPILDTVDKTNRTLFEIAESGWLSSVALAVGLGLYLSSLWLFVRWSRWPLLNIFLATALLAVLSIGTNWLVDPATAVLFGFIPPNLKIYLLPIIYSFVALVLFGINFFLPPAKSWKTGAES